METILAGLGIGDDRFSEALEIALEDVQSLEGKHSQLPSMFISRGTTRGELKRLLHNSRLIDKVAPLHASDYHQGLGEYRDERWISKEDAEAVLTADKVATQAAILRGLMHPTFDEAFLKILE